MGFKINRRELSSVPVMGWESKKCNANEARVNGYDLGSVCTETWKVEGADAKIARKNKLSNAGKVLGAFPLVTGQFVGLVRIITTITDSKHLYGDKHPLLNKTKHIIRGVSEIFGLGAVWLILDLIATSGRFIARIERVNTEAF